MSDPDTVPLEVSYDENANPVEIEYHHMVFGLMKLAVEDGVASLDPKWDRLGDKSLKEGYDRWVTTGDVLRSVEQLPFIGRIEAPHHAPKDVQEEELITDGGQPVPEQIRETIEDSDWPELSIREIMERTGLSKEQVVATAGSMDRLELDRNIGAVRIPEDDGGEFVDDPERELRTDGGQPSDPEDGPVVIENPPNVYEQAKERAHDDLDRTELTNMVYGLPVVGEVLVDGEDEDWRPTTIMVGFNEDYGSAIDDAITVMQRAGWSVDGVTFGAYRRIQFKKRGAGDAE